MTLWRKQAVGYCQHPKVVAAGQDAAMVFLVLLDLNTELARDGELLERDVAERVVAGRCPVISARRVRAAMAACVAHGLVERTRTGLRICGWSDEWRPRKVLPEVETATCTRCGGPKVADAYRQCEDCRDYERSRWNARNMQSTPQGLRRDSAAETPQNSAVHSAGTPQRSGAETPQGLRRDSADLNGNPSGMLPQIEEKRQDQSREELMDGWMDGVSLVPQGIQRASEAQETRARAQEPDRIVAELARKLRAE